MRTAEVLNRAFNRFSTLAARWAGRPLSFALAVLVVLAWLISGPLSGFSDSWQLGINTATTIITFVMVFLIQNTQNRDTEAIQIKLDEQTLDRYRGSYEALARQSRGVAEIWETD